MKTIAENTLKEEKPECAIYWNIFYFINTFINHRGLYCVKTAEALEILSKQIGTQKPTK